MLRTQMCRCAYHQKILYYIILLKIAALLELQCSQYIDLIVIHSNIQESEVNLCIYSFFYQFRNESNLVNEINKRNLGKMIIRYVGHEGLEEKAGLRCLLQACIDFLQTEADEVWKNASITIFDEDFNKYEIASGAKTHQFICRMKNGIPFIKEQKHHTDFRDNLHCSIF